jgi:hypothetical protein
MYPVTAGRIPAGGVHLTNTPSATILEYTLVGASGNTYEFACAVGTISEIRSAADTATTPRTDFFEVDFMAVFNRDNNLKEGRWG